MGKIIIIIGMLILVFSLTLVNEKKHIKAEKQESNKKLEQYNLQGDVIYKEGKPYYYKVKPDDQKHNSNEPDQGILLEIDPD